MIIGNLTRDPELRYTASGTAIVTFGVATNREYTPSDKQETVEAAEFHNIVAWARLAELCNQLLTKGAKVYIEGRLQTRDWVDAESSKKMYRTEIVAEEMIVLSARNPDTPRSVDEPAVTAPVAVEEGSSKDQSEKVPTDEIPF